MTYHLEVKTTSGGLEAPVKLTDNQIRLAKNYSRLTSSNTNHLYVLVRVCYLQAGNELGAKLGFFVDPLDCIYRAASALRAEKADGGFAVCPALIGPARSTIGKLMEEDTNPTLPQPEDDEPILLQPEANETSLLHSEQNESTESLSKQLETPTKQLAENEVPSSPLHNSYEPQFDPDDDATVPTANQLPPPAFVFGASQPQATVFNFEPT